MKKSRQQDRDIPGPQAPWSEIAPGLWMGGHYWTDASGAQQQAVVGSEFDVVISLFTVDGHGPSYETEHVIGEIPDAPLTPVQIRTVQRLARTVKHAMDGGLTTLVRCHSGYNRSGLVVAQTLIDAGHAPSEAIDLIRRRRSPYALNNDLFEAYLTTGLDIAALLSELEPPV
ncbi:dual specificity protein phosphatase family protein [Streptomyces sp. WAC06614]|uniref:protein-tyrosine phosphatase family protein n=1 Tax=Streptomyces sp. WAC06614 TaxID=2487416 RepID=UPI000F77E0C6|nr:dual specificity protein phosphatase family protein [Streptomyces sp. WAC06614]RSS74801.1 protein phosphatase [Streptomyces sp. WAC06614]